MTFDSRAQSQDELERTQDPTAHYWNQRARANAPKRAEQPIPAWNDVYHQSGESRGTKEQEVQSQVTQSPYSFAESVRKGRWPHRRPMSPVEKNEHINRER